MDAAGPGDGNEMSDAPKKPRNLKNLRARLGRTIAPNTQQGGGAAVPPPGVGGIPAPGVPAPAAQPKPAAPAAPPFGAPAQPAAPAPSAAPVAPPFGAPAQPAAPAQPKPAADPFGASAPAAAPQEVRLVIDETPVDEAEVGKKSRTKVFMLVGVGLFAGLLVGAGMASVVNENRAFNVAVRAGKAVYEKINAASSSVQDAQRLASKLAKSLEVKPGSAPKIDFDSLQKLQQIEKPFDPKQLAPYRKGLLYHDPAVLDALIEYSNLLDTFWTKASALASKSLAKQRRDVLEESARMVGSMQGTQAGCILTEVDKELKCGLVYVHGQPGPDGKVRVSSTLRGRTFEKILYKGQEDLLQKPSDYVIVADPRRSRGVLRSSVSAFAEFRKEAMELKELADKLLEVQGRALEELGKVASQSERFAL